MMSFTPNLWFLHFIFISLSVGCFGSQECADISQISVNDHRFDGDLLESVSPIGYQQCRTKCRTRQACLSINFNRERLLCELLKITTTSIAQLTVVRGYTFTDLNTTDVIPPGDVCQRDSCPEEHLCIKLKSTGNRTCVEDTNAVATTTTTTTTTPTTTTTTPTTTTTTPTNTMTTPTTTTTTPTATTTTPTATTTTPTTTMTTPTTTTTTPTTTMTTPTTTTATPTTAIITLTTTSVSTRNGCVHTDFIFEPSLDLCYFLSTSTTVVYGASHACNQYENGGLMIVDSAEKIQFIRSLINNSGFSYWWIDGSKAEDGDGIFRWSTGQVVDPTPISDNGDEPVMVIKDDDDVFYSKHPTDNSYPYICEEYA